MTRSPIYFILLLSVAIHGTVIFLWNQSSHTISVRPSAQQNITIIPVSLNAAPKPQPVIKKIISRKPAPEKVKHSPAPKKQPVKILTVHNKPDNKQHKEPVVMPVKKPASTEAIQPAAETQATRSQKRVIKKIVLDKQMIQQRIRKQLNLKLAFSRYYPAIAVRNQWQGTVNLGIRIQANGQLGQIHVISSSGYRILDQAAVNSVMKINALPAVKHWLKGNNFDVILPVIYQLADS